MSLYPLLDPHFPIHLLLEWVQCLSWEYHYTKSLFAIILFSQTSEFPSGKWNMFTEAWLTDFIKFETNLSFGRHKKYENLHKEILISYEGFLICVHSYSLCYADNFIKLFLANLVSFLSLRNITILMYGIIYSV